MRYNRWVPFLPPHWTDQFFISRNLLSISCALIHKYPQVTKLQKQIEKREHICGGGGGERMQEQPIHFLFTFDSNILLNSPNDLSSDATRFAAQGPDPWDCNWRLRSFTIFWSLKYMSIHDNELQYSHKYEYFLTMLNIMQHFDSKYLREQQMRPLRSVWHWIPSLQSSASTFVHLSCKCCVICRC